MALFEKELVTNGRLEGYYRLLSNRKRYWFRRAYLEQRLQYVADHTTGTALHIWDAGCGYATTGIFLALNGHRVYGNTLEFYAEGIRERLEFWGKHGNLQFLEVKHENLMNHCTPERSYDIILVQDTLHHLEPVHEALDLFHRMLRPRGKLLVVEENGDSLFIRAKNLRIRGLKRKGIYHDERTGESIPFGYENARGRKTWYRLLESAGFDCDSPDLEFIRILPPFLMRGHKYQQMLQLERKIGRNCKGFRKFFYFGMNFTVTKTI
jgi:SAM-dependent methyltransferase